MFIVPTTSDPNQNFRCVIPVDGKNLALLFTLQYNSEAEYWTMAITDDLTGSILISGLPLLAGQYPSANILEQYTFLRIGSVVMVKINPDNPADSPDGTNLGVDFQLVWSDTIL